MEQDIYKTLNDIFYEFLPMYGFSVRHSQAGLSYHMLETIQKCGVALCEAGVGTGKTHAYIMAAVMQMFNNPNFTKIRQSYPCDRDYYKTTKMPIVISTSSIQLQRSITQEYIPEISRILMKQGVITEPLTFVVRKGKEHYACDRRLNDYLMSVDVENDGELFCKLDALAAADFRQIDLDMLDMTRYLKSRINVPVWCNTFCPRYDHCRYTILQLFQKMNQHHFQVCNHNFFFADLSKRRQSQRPLIPNYQAVIFDEAHKLVDAARQIYGFTLSAAEMLKLTGSVTLLMRFQSKAAMREVESICVLLNTTSEGLFKSLEKAVKAYKQGEIEHYSVSLTVIQRAYIRNLADTLKRLQSLFENKAVSRQKHGALYLYITQTINQLIMRLELLAAHYDYILWLDLPKSANGTALLNAIPKQLDGMLYKDFWSRPIPVILTSGTLSAAGSFEHYKKSVGLDRALIDRSTELTQISPFDYENNCLLYLAADLPFPDPKDPLYIEAAARRVGRLIQATHGHTLVLFTSYRVMELVYLKLKGAFPYPFIKVGRGIINALEQFKKSGNGVLFAAGSFWEGVDLPGDILSSLIVVKLPFPQPDPVSDYERTLYDSDQSYIKEAIIPQMLIKLKQGAGRLIRNETDTGVISVLDSRLQEYGKYRRDVIRTLPKCRVTSNIDDVERFIKAKKGADYFK